MQITCNCLPPTQETQTNKALLLFFFNPLPFPPTTKKKSTKSSKNCSLLTNLLGRGITLKPGDRTPIGDESPHDETHVGMGEAIEHNLGLKQFYVEDGVHGA